MSEAEATWKRQDDFFTPDYVELGVMGKCNIAAV